MACVCQAPSYREEDEGPAGLVIGVSRISKGPKKRSSWYIQATWRTRVLSISHFSSLLFPDP